MSFSIYASLKNPPPMDNGMLRIALYSDDFLFNAIAASFCCMNVLPDKQYSQRLLKFKPDLFIVSSSVLNRKHLKNNMSPVPTITFSGIISLCRQIGVPVIFWDTTGLTRSHLFYNAAKMMDYIFTTNENDVELYKMMLGHERVYLLSEASDFRVLRNQSVEQDIGGPSTDRQEEYREVVALLHQGSYIDRVLEIANRIFNTDYRQKNWTVAVVSEVSTTREAELVLKGFDRQSYPYKSLHLVVDRDLTLPGREDVTVYKPGELNTDGLNDFDYIAYFSPKHYYSVQYLEDLILATGMDDMPVFGKNSCYTWNGSEAIVHYQSPMYALVEKMTLDRCIFKPELMPMLPNGKMEGLSLSGVCCQSVDPFNFCENYVSADGEGPLALQSSNHRVVGAEAIESPITTTYCNDGRTISDNIFQRNGVKKDIFGDWVGIIAASPLDKTKEIRLTGNLSVEQYAYKDYLNVVVHASVEGGLQIWLMCYDKQGTVAGQYHLTEDNIITVETDDSWDYFEVCVAAPAPGWMLLKALLVNTY